MNKGKNVAEDMRRTLNDQFMTQGVEVSDVIITDVCLPDVIVGQMAQKTMVISQNAAQKMNQVHSALRVSGVGHMSYLHTLHTLHGYVSLAGVRDAHAQAD